MGLTLGLYSALRADSEMCLRFRRQPTEMVETMFLVVRGGVSKVQVGDGEMVVVQLTEVQAGGLLMPRSRSFLNLRY